MHFFRQFKDHNSGKENENYKNDPIFSSTFSALPACNIHFWIWKYLKFFCKFITTVHSGLQNTSIFSFHTFLESRHPEVTKNHILFTCRSKIMEVEENFIQNLSAFYYFYGNKTLAFKSPFDLYSHSFIIEFFWFT